MPRPLNDAISDHYPGLDALPDFLTKVHDMLHNRVLGNPTLAIDSNFDVKNSTAYDYVLAGRVYTDAINGNCDTGTAATFPTTTWGIFKVSVDAAGDLTATWATNASAGYATEALAIAALPDTPADEVAIGYVTVEAHATGTFLAGTDALEGGAGGDVANSTNYYNMDSVGNWPSDPDAAT